MFLYDDYCSLRDVSLVDVFTEFVFHLVDEVADSRFDVVSQEDRSLVTTVFHSVTGVDIG